MSGFSFASKTLKTPFKSIKSIAKSLKRTLISKPPEEHNNILHTLSSICYNFIDENKSMFDLKQYDKNDHSMNFDLLDEITKKQTCSKPFFEILNRIYKESTYISSDIFQAQYEKNIRELRTTYHDREIIVVFPVGQIDKSNFFFTLYFLYLYKKIVGKKVKYVLVNYTELDDHYNELSAFIKSNVEHMKKKEPLYVFCDDFVYSGKQLSNNISFYTRTESIQGKAKSVYACIVGMYGPSIERFNSDTTIFPEHKIVIDKNFKSIVKSIIHTNTDYYFQNDEKPQTGTTDYKSDEEENDDIHKYIRQNDMYVLEVKEYDDKLFAVGQLRTIYNSYNMNESNTLVYLFFKYPDMLSTIQKMCFMYQYGNTYTVKLDKLTIKPTIMNKYKDEMFEITDKFFENKEDFSALKKHILNPTTNQDVLDKIDWIEKCIDIEYASDIVPLTIGPTWRNISEKAAVSLIKNLDKTTIRAAMCNGSIIPFYKNEKLEMGKKFTELKEIIRKQMSNTIREQRYNTPETGGDRKKKRVQRTLRKRKSAAN
jgi:hypothetical protein